MVLDVNERVNPPATAEAQFIHLGVEIALTTRCSASASSTPRCARDHYHCKERIFCRWRQYFMLGPVFHSGNVNFCKFTNERSTASKMQAGTPGRVLAACNGTTAGRLDSRSACDEIYLVDDRSSPWLAEVPLLVVLPAPAD